MTNDTEIVLQDPSTIIASPDETTAARVGGVFGTEAVKDLISQVMQAAKLDRNNDGKISRTEWIAALSSLAPSLFQADEVVAELKDLTEQELIEITAFVEAHFPDYTNVRQEVEDLIRQVFATLVEIQKLIIAIKNLKTPELK